jgi:hypothetical protein
MPRSELSIRNAKAEERSYKLLCESGKFPLWRAPVPNMTYYSPIPVGLFM